MTAGEPSEGTSAQPGPFHLLRQYSSGLRTTFLRTNRRYRAIHVSLARASIALLTALAVVLLVMGLQIKPDAATTCTDSLQDKLDAAAQGTTVRAEPCVYREQITITKPITLQGQPGSEVRGSDVWTDWTYSGGYWRSSKSLPTFPQTEVRCMPNTSRCLWPEQVFFDGKALAQVASEPQSGQFAVDSGRRVLLEDDPG